VTFYIAVVFTVWVFRVGPAVVVALFGAATAIYFFVEPLYTFRVADARDVIWLLFYLIVNATIIAAIEAQKRARAQLRVEIDSRESAERAEAEQRQWYETTLRSIGDAVIATDNAGQVTFLNSVAEALTGWTSEDAAGRPIAEVFVIRNGLAGARCTASFPFPSGMVHQTDLHRPPRQCHPQCGQRQFIFQRPIQGPADYPARAGIQDYRHEHELF
jgi:PAS domain-containing protein